MNNIEQRKAEILEANSETVRLTAQLLQQRTVAIIKRNTSGRFVGLQNVISSPSKFWGWSVLEANERLDDDSVNSIQTVIELCSARLMAGDLKWVFESSVGQVAWLSSMALHLRELSNEVDSPHERQQLVSLALKAQAAAAKLMFSLAALSGVGDSGGREVEVDG